MAKKNITEKVEDIVVEPQVIVEEKPVEEVKTFTGTTAVRVNVRLKPSLESDIIDVLSPGEIVTLKNKTSKNGFYQITLINGVVGYIKSEFIKVEK